LSSTARFCRWRGDRPVHPSTGGEFLDQIGGRGEWQSGVEIVTIIVTEDGASAVGCSRRDAPVTLSFFRSSTLREKTSAGFSSAGAPSAADSLALSKQNNSRLAVRFERNKNSHPEGSGQRIGFTRLVYVFTK